MLVVVEHTDRFKRPDIPLSIKYYSTYSITQQQRQPNIITQSNS